MNPRHSATIRRSALLLCLLLGCVAREAGAQTVRAATEVGAYQDTTATSVLTPTIRAAIDHPWVFREARAALRGERIAGPTDEERRAMFALLTAENVALRGERVGVGVARRHARVLGEQIAALRPRLFAARSLVEVRDILGA